MKTKPGFKRLGASLLVASGLISCFPGFSRAQQAGDGKLDSCQSREQACADPSPSGNQRKAAPAKVHRFWDQENDWLFAGVGASRTLDYFSTLNMRRRGRQEIFLTNDAVDNHAAFAAIEASATGVSIGAAYLFHRYGHHRLERWTSIVHIGLAATGSVRNYCLKTAHLAPAAGSP
jgi:hypothetical protein